MKGKEAVEHELAARTCRLSGRLKAVVCGCCNVWQSQASTAVILWQQRPPPHLVSSAVVGPTFR